MRQKRSIVINDLSGVGRCALSAILPILAIFDHEVINVPTVVLSSSTAYPGFVMNDMSSYVPKYLNQYDEIGYEFDGCMVGYIGNLKVASVIEEYLDSHKFPLLLVDPIMGDNGHLYKNYNDELVEAVRSLCKYADLITPNITEFFALIGEEYDDEPSDEVLFTGCEKLGNKMIVISGVERDGKIGNYIYHDGIVSFYDREKSLNNRSGTGDVFSAVLYGCLKEGYELEEAVKISADFVFDAIKRSEDLVEDCRAGLAYEGLLGKLLSTIKK